MFNILFGAFIFLWLTDFVTTAIALKKVGLSEANPFVKLLLRLGYLKGMLFLSLYKILGGLFVYFLHMYVVVIFGILVMAYVCYSNGKCLCGR